MHRIFLVGFMAAGKTSMGRALAQLLSTRFVDVDELLSRRFGMTITEVFERYGEPAFRTAETEELAAAAALGGCVVATGGGAFCSEENRRLIDAAGGISVYLHLPWEVLRRRLESDHGWRPMYGDPEHAERLWQQRLPHYRLATLTVELTGEERPEEAAVVVAETLRETPCAT